MHKIVCLLLIISLCCFCCHRSDKQDHVSDLPQELQDLYAQIDKDAKNPELFNKLAVYFIQNQQLDSALSAISKAIALDSANETYYLTLSDVYFAQTNVDLSEETLEKVLAINPKNEEAMLKLAELHFLLKRYDLSQKFAEQSLKTNSYNPKAYFLLGWIFREKGDTAMAINNYLKATEQNSDYYDAYMELGILYHCRQNALAIDYYNNALNCKVNDFQALYNKAMFYQEAKDYDKALEIYKMILQNDVHNKMALHNMGWVYMAQGKYEEGFVFFSKAIEEDETYIEAIYNRGLCSEMLNEKDKARQDFMYCLKLDDRYQLAIDGLNRLD